MTDSLPLVKQQLRILQSLAAGGWIVSSDRNGRQSFYVAMPKTDVRFYVANAHFFRLSNLGYIQHNPLMEEWVITPDGRQALREWEKTK